MENLIKMTSIGGSKKPLIIGAIVVVLAIGLGIWLYTKNQKKKDTAAKAKETEDATKAAAIAAAAKQPDTISDEYTPLEFKAAVVKENGWAAALDAIAVGKTADGLPVKASVLVADEAARITATPAWVTSISASLQHYSDNATKNVEINIRKAALVALTSFGEEGGWKYKGKDSPITRKTA